ncbi:MAG: hypothetical protein F4Z00_00620 [Acidimicrobiaceae bacterium]|nr:hypothetical protein [Acidimicrobiaceae bacterium]MCY3643051.1 hypothetical protein [Acidimicrobiaceae bacterium]MDE0492399.1 hypothetical protein [Acidimicrobiaceae bacterium]MDE0666827.1 hypothetical protein [Acidimicrobiaceae bacterium]MXW89723.1 hypothetical protein [Acidimicrobiaceae bacterium]
MSVVSALHASAALLLVVAGAAKLIRPADGFAGLVGLRTRPFVVRLIGALEAGAGIAALILGGPAAWIVGLLYAAFALVVLRAVLAGADSCGCFGRLDAPPSLIHVAGNLTLAAVSFIAAGAASPPVSAVVQAAEESSATGVALASVIALLAGLVLVSFTALPEALAARSPRRDGEGLFRPLPPPTTVGAAADNGSGRP